MAQYPGNSLKTGAKWLLVTGLYSDVTIVCGIEFKVHKFVLHTQSPYFKKLFAGRFKEGAANSNLTRLELDEDPDIFAVLIKHLYYFTYDDSSRGDVAPAPFAVYVYAAADKYDVEPLRKQAAKRLEEVLDPKDVGTFIDTVRAIDDNTADRVLWDIVVPAIKANMSFLLGHKAFQDLLLEKKDLNFRLLAMIDPSGGAPPIFGSESVVGEEVELEEGSMDEHEHVTPVHGLQSHRHGLGRRLG